MRSRLILLTLVGTVLAVVLLAAPAAAQTTPPTTDSELSLQIPFMRALEPGSTVQETVGVTYEWQGAGAPQGSTQVTISYETNFSTLKPWAEMTIEPSTLEFTPDNQPGQETQNVNLTVEVGDTPPATIGSRLDIQAHAERNGQIQQAWANRTGPDARRFFSRYVENVEVEVPPSVSLSGGTEEISVVVRNRGNGPVSLNVTNVDLPDGVDATLPEGAVLGVDPELIGDVRGASINPEMEDAYLAPHERTLTLQVEGSGSGSIAFDVETSPWGEDEDGEVTTTSRQVAIEPSGLPILPIVLLLVLLAGAAGGGYVIWSRRDDEDDDAEDEGSAEEPDDPSGETGTSDEPEAVPAAAAGSEEE